MGRPGTPGPRSVDDDGQAHNCEDISVKALRVQFKYLVGQYSKRRWLDGVGWWLGDGWNLDGVG